MMRLQEKIVSLFTVTALVLQVAEPVLAQQSGQPAVSQARIEVTTELVLVNVVARDKKGNLVRDLKKEDFTLLEDGDEMATADGAEATVSGVAADGALLRSPKKAPPSLDARDRRLILVFFD